uniref:Ribosomal protein L20 n=1 Tax=Canis lupus familiaris TaxID=9615 RepID=A0A8C0MH22_CANLF
VSFLKYFLWDKHHLNTSALHTYKIKILSYTRKNFNEYKLTVRAVTRAFVKCTKARRLKKRNMRTLWINRITAASQELWPEVPGIHCPFN